jgi:hypothetical protein
MEKPQQSLTHLDYLLERLSRALVPLAFVKVYAMQENLKNSSKE